MFMIVFPLYNDIVKNLHDDYGFFKGNDFLSIVIFCHKNGS